MVHLMDNGCIAAQRNLHACDLHLPVCVTIINLASCIREDQGRTTHETVKAVHRIPKRDSNTRMQELDLLIHSRQTPCGEFSIVHEILRSSSRPNFVCRLLFHTSLLGRVSFSVCPSWSGEECYEASNGKFSGTKLTSVISIFKLLSAFMFM